eukprot:m.13583 g.13583  ORF g.13583 m.13583 type:complete len:144 (-) comp5962_c0_seq1:401-832(-)
MALQTTEGFVVAIPQLMGVGGTLHLIGYLIFFSLSGLLVALNADGTVDLSARAQMAPAYIGIVTSYILSIHISAVYNEGGFGNTSNISMLVPIVNNTLFLVFVILLEQVISGERDSHQRNIFTPVLLALVIMLLHFFRKSIRR